MEQISHTATEAFLPNKRSEMLRSRYLLIVLLALTSILACVRDRVSMMNYDEFNEFYTDSQPTTSAMIHVQKATPITLDPALYHLLAHGAIGILGKSSFASRLPSLLGLLLAQIALYGFMRKTSASRASILAALLPLVLGGFEMSVLGRPYGLLFGLCAAALYCWQWADRSSPGKRNAALFFLGISIAAAINTHYYGVLILVPLYLGEITRSISQRKIDVPVYLALLAGTASVVFFLPFLPGTKLYPHPFFTLHGAHLTALMSMYRELAGVPSKLATLVFLFVLIVLGYVALQAKPSHVTATIDLSDRAALLAFLALPFVGMAMCMVAGHDTLAPRYVIGTIVGGCLGLAILVNRAIKSDRLFHSVVLILLLAATVSIMKKTGSARRDLLSLKESVAATGAVETYLDTHPTDPIYAVEAQSVMQGRYYGENSALRQNLHLAYSVADDNHWLHTDAGAITAYYLSQISDVPTAPFDSLVDGQSRPIAMIQYPDHYDWSAQELRAHGKDVQVVGPYLLGTLVLVYPSK